MEQQLADIISRLTTLEASRVIPTEEDYSDPPLYLTNTAGQPVSPDSIEKIPDVVKDLPNFTGDPNEISMWINDAQGLITLYKPRNDSTIEQRNKYHMVCKTIRRKIRGEANDALVASNVNLNWNLIRRTLETYYGEKRDIGTLDYQLMNNQQRGRSLEEYYDDINRLLSLIANQIKNDPRFTHPEASKAMIETFNDKALDAFVRGLDGDIGKFLKNYRPDSLAGAYAYCISFQNIEFRKNLTRARIPETPQGPRNMIPLPNNRIPPRLPPKPIYPIMRKPNPHFIPPRQTFNPRPFPQQPQAFNPRPFIQQQPQAFNPRYFQQQPQQQFYKPQIPPRNNFQKPEPMEVDPSIHTKQINYGNRPQNQNPPLKRPRLFNLASNNQTLDVKEYPVTYNEYNQQDSIPEHWDPSIEKYIQTVEVQEPETEIEEQEAEFNFLG